MPMTNTVLIIHPSNRRRIGKKLINKTFTEAEQFSVLIENLPDNKFDETFIEEKYGIYYRNLHGIIEHTHYHLGQIVILKKIVLSEQQES